MAYKFPKLAPTLLTKIGRLPMTARAHRFWFTTLSATLFLITAAFVLGYSSLRRSRALQAEEERLQQVRARVDGWISGFRAPSPAESLVWMGSERVLEELQAGAAEPAAVAALITERAERLGIEDVRVTLMAADSAPPPPDRALRGWTLTPRLPPLLVEFRAEFIPVIEFVDALPPHVEVKEVRLERQGARVHARFELIAYRAVRR